MKIDLTKYQNFFSNRVENLNDNKKNKFALISQQSAPSKRSQSIGNLIKPKQILDEKVKQFLTTRKVGLLTGQINKEIKSLRRYADGYKNIQIMVEQLNRVKKEHNDYGTKILKMNEQIKKIGTNIKLSKDKIQQYENTSRFTQQNLHLKDQQYRKLCTTMEQQTINKKIYAHILERTKLSNNRIKFKVNQIRNQIKLKSSSITSLQKSVYEKQKKIQQSITATNYLKASMRKTTFQLNKNLQIAKQTIYSKLSIIKSSQQTQQIKKKAALQAQIKYSNMQQIDSIWRQYYSHKLFGIILDRCKMIKQQKDVELQRIFSRITNGRIVQNIKQFSEVYRNSIQNNKKINERLIQLQNKAQQQQKINKKLTQVYILKTLQSQIDQVKQNAIIINQQKQLRIANAKKINASITLWCNKIYYRIQTLLAARQQHVTLTNTQIILLIINLLKNQVSNPSQVTQSRQNKETYIKNLQTNKQAQNAKQITKQGQHKQTQKKQQTADI